MGRPIKCDAQDHDERKAPALSGCSTIHPPYILPLDISVVIISDEMVSYSGPIHTKKGLESAVITTQRQELRSSW